MKNTIAIITDTACDLPEELAKSLDIRIVPLRVLWKGKDFRDRYEVTSSEIFSMMEEEIPTTSLPNQQDFYDALDELAGEGYQKALYLTISSGISGTYNAARLWAQEYERMEVTVLDTRAASMAQGGMAIEAAKRAKEGGSMEEIIKRAEEVRKSTTALFVVQTLEYLKKGGRISALEGTLGSLLHIRPVIALKEDGTLGSVAKAKGFKRALSAMLEMAKERYGGKRVRLTAMHCDNQEGAEKLADEVRAFSDVAECFVIQLNPTLAVHTGRGLLGLTMHELD